MNDQAAKKGYREKAMDVLWLQYRSPYRHERLPLEDLEKEFRQELAEAKDWYEELHQNEVSWIREGKNPEQEFDKLYEHEPELTPSQDEPAPATRRWVAFAAVGLTVAAVVAWLFRKGRRRSPGTLGDPG